MFHLLKLFAILMVSVNNHSEPPISTRSRSLRSQSNSPRLVIDEGNSVNGDPDENVSNGTTQSLNADLNDSNQEAIADHNTNNVDNETNQVRNANNGQVDGNIQSNETNQVRNAINGQVDGNIQSNGTNQDTNGDNDDAIGNNVDIEGGENDGDNSEIEIEDTRLTRSRSQHTPILTNILPVCSAWEIEKIEGYHVDKEGNTLVRFRYPAYWAPLSTFTDLKNLNRFRKMSKANLMKNATEFIQEMKAAVQKIKDNPIVFECLYCEATFKTLKSCKNHVFGVRVSAKTSGNYHSRLKLDCRKRLMKDGFKYPESKIPVSLPEPKMYPWARVTCLDESLKTGPDEFPVPEKIQKQWDDVFNPKK